MDLGARIAAWRKVRGMTQRDLAKEVGLTAGAISQFEGRGKFKASPSMATLDAIIEAFGLTSERFYGRVRAEQVLRRARAR